MRKPKRLYEMSEEERIKTSDEYAVAEAERQRLEDQIKKKSKVKDSKIAKRALRRLIKRHKKVFDSLAKGSQSTNKGDNDELV